MTRRTGNVSSGRPPTQLSDAAQAARLRSAAIRVTKQRIAALDVLEVHPHSDAHTVKTLISGQIGTVSTQAVYDVLAVLVRIGLVRKIERGGSPALFELERSDNHHHVTCRICRCLVDVDCVTGQAPCVSTAGISGFVVDEAEVTYWGTCEACIPSNSDCVDASATTEENR